MTKREAIARSFIKEFGAQIQSNPDGMHAAVRATWDKVFPAVSYDAFVEDLYHSLRAQAGLSA